MLRCCLVTDVEEGVVGENLLYFFLRSELLSAGHAWACCGRFERQVLENP